ncbi:MAG TPA: hypothetical protein VIC51_09130 [Psychromonas sp.]
MKMPTIIIAIAIAGNIAFSIYEKDWTEAAGWSCALCFFINLKKAK